MKQQSFYQKRLVYGDAGSIEFQRWTWGKWLGHEKEYFRECYSLIQPLTWKDVQLICGPSLVSKEQTALAAYAKLISDYFPEVLKLGDFHHADQENDVVRIWTSNPYDPINMSRNTFRRLHQLSGKPMTEVMQEIPTELLQKLFDSGILL